MEEIELKHAQQLLDRLRSDAASGLPEPPAARGRWEQTRLAIGHLYALMALKHLDRGNNWITGADVYKTIIALNPDHGRPTTYQGLESLWRLGLIEREPPEQSAGRYRMIARGEEALRKELETLDAMRRLAGQPPPAVDPSAKRKSAAPEEGLSGFGRPLRLPVVDGPEGARCLRLPPFWADEQELDLAERPGALLLTPTRPGVMPALRSLRRDLAADPKTRDALTQDDDHGDAL